MPIHIELEAAPLFFDEAAHVSLAGMHPSLNVNQPLPHLGLGHLEISGIQRLADELAATLQRP